MKLAPPDIGDDDEGLADMLGRALVEERERIAHDLDAVVMQRLLALALHLQGTLTLLEGRAATRVAEVVDEFDSIITDVRTVIFNLVERSEPRDR